MSITYKRTLKVLLILFLISMTCTNVNAAKIEKGKSCTLDAATNTYRTETSIKYKEGYITASIKKGQFLVKVYKMDGQGINLGNEEYVLNANAANGDINPTVNIYYNPSITQTISIVFVFIDPNDELCYPNGQSTKNAIKNSDKVINLYQVDAKSYISIHTHDIAGAVVKAPVRNKNYDGLCKNLREGTWNDKLSTLTNGSLKKSDFLKYNPKATNSEAEYRGYINYCYTQTVETNYNDKTVARMIKNAIRSYRANHLPSGEYRDITVPTGIEKNYNLSSGGEYPKFSSSDVEKLTCNPLKLGTKENHYVNNHKFYAYNTSSSQEYLPKSKKTLTCDKKCAEEITVSYGPPVATRGGLCFEYKVKVESKVTCSAVFNGSMPTRTGYQECDPVPICSQLEGYVGNQAGPSEDFDKCISKCDGGKYSQKCINKCYSKVYKNTKSNKLSSPFLEAKVTKINNPACPTSVDEIDGYYYRKSNGEISWQAGSGYWSKYARWYFYGDNLARTCEHDDGSGGAGDWRRGYKLTYTADSDGFKTAVQFRCTDNCHYVGCDEENEYLSADEAEEDYEEDIEAYEAFKESCVAQSSCSTRTAEFTIKVNNKTTDNPTKDNWINYDAATIKNGNLNDPSEVVLDRNYCYGLTQSPNRYQTEWSFPGTWINNKTGEIRYTPVRGKEWHKKESYFCTNLNSADVNKDWWYYGMTGDEKYKPSQAVLNNLEYNILASTRSFGHYAWNIDVSCFYALRDNTCDNCKCDCSDPSCKDPKCKEPGKDPTKIKKKNLSYRIRSVNTKDLFPSVDGKTNDGYAETGRAPGFNWTGDATNIKNKDYIVSPDLLTTDIQQKAGTIYNDESDSSKDLDYRFYLDRTAINTIRNYSKNESNGKYTNFSGVFEIRNGVSVYKSALFRNAGSSSYRLDSRYIKKLGLLGCNNQANSDKCENYATIIGG